jgi:hypothetical protein
MRVQRHGQPSRGGRACSMCASASQPSWSAWRATAVISARPTRLWRGVRPNVKVADTALQIRCYLQQALLILRANFEAGGLNNEQVAWPVTNLTASLNRIARPDHA